MEGDADYVKSMPISRLENDSGDTSLFRSASATHSIRFFASHSSQMWAWDGDAFETQRSRFTQSCHLCTFNFWSISRVAWRHLALGPERRKQPSQIFCLLKMVFFGIFEMNSVNRSLSRRVRVCACPRVSMLARAWVGLEYMGSHQC